MKSNVSGLQNAIRWYSLSAVLGVGLVIALVVLLPLQTRLFDFQKSHLVFARDVAVMVINQTLRPMQEIAHKISSDVDAQTIMQHFNDGKISQPEATALLDKIIYKNLSDHPNVALISRLNHKGLALVTRTKTKVSDDFLKKNIIPYLKLQAPIFDRKHGLVFLIKSIENNHHQPLGYILCAFHLSHFEKLLHEAVQTKLGRTFVFYEDRNQIRWVGMSNLYPKTQMLLTDNAHLNTVLLRALQKNQPGIDSDVFSNSGMVIAFSPVLDTQWGVAIVADRVDLYQSAEKTIFVLFAIVILVLLLFAFGLNRVLKPLSGKLLLRDAELAELLEKSQEKLKILNMQLYELAIYDSLTHLLSRLAFYQRAEAEIARAKRNNRECVLFFIDLNNFKPLNDQFGHDAGDAYLKEFALRLLREVRKEDIVARMGGDEFVIMLVDTGSGIHSLEILERIKKAVAKPVEYAGHEFTLGASFGVAVFPKDAENLDALIKIADSRMYAEKAKMKGAN